MHKVNINTNGDLENRIEEMFQLFLQMKNKPERFGPTPSLSFEQRNLAFANNQ
jgi:hypothetical protein